MYASFLATCLVRFVVKMELIKKLVAPIIPIPFSMCFLTSFDGLIQAYVFVFLTALYQKQWSNQSVGVIKTIKKRKGDIYYVNSYWCRYRVLTGVGAGVGIGLATSKAVDAITRQPEAEGKISKALLLGCALAEATAIYGFCYRSVNHLILKIMPDRRKKFKEYR